MALGLGVDVLGGLAWNLVRTYVVDKLTQRNKHYICGGSRYGRFRP